MQPEHSWAAIRGETEMELEKGLKVEPEVKIEVE